MEKVAVNVIMFNNGRTPGGRMASRDTGNGKVDYGAPCLNVTDPEFRQVVATWQANGLVRPWNATVANWQDSKMEALPGLKDHFCSESGGIASIPSHLSKGLKIHNA
jgi:renalase